MCSTVQEQITTCGQNAIVKIGERTNIRPQKLFYNAVKTWLGGHLAVVDGLHLVLEAFQGSAVDSRL